MPSFKRKSRPSSFKLQKGKDVESRNRKTRALYFWTCEDVMKWLRKHCGIYHGLYASIFKNHAIDGKCKFVIEI